MQGPFAKVLHRHFCSSEFHMEIAWARPPNNFLTQFCMMNCPIANCEIIARRFSHFPRCWGGPLAGGGQCKTRPLGTCATPERDRVKNPTIGVPTVRTME
jgi:hypothetical protein